MRIQIIRNGTFLEETVAPFFVSSSRITITTPIGDNTYNVKGTEWIVPDTVKVYVE